MQQQGREVLAAGAAGKFRPPAGEAAGDPDRRAAVALLGNGLNPHLAEGREQLP